MQAAITRLAVLVILLVNQTLITFGWNPLPFSEEQVYEGVSAVATVAVAVWAWWKNNNVTKKAQHNEKFLKDRGMK
ncbi:MULTISPECIES: phage holin [Oceanobacillus]|uniref:Phage holin n=1 Tax=Oceanobacillus indicireducens TaxID=1004261 RepID=A0A917Y6E9_9BACI|nr:MULTISPECIES: phage holin [Oceanobacillus]MCF3942224.1 phage holin [Oceanobacillus alkalisoli]GGN67622.1 hypothetical protein GCM10007971_38620 [Oceanobacillus indicireducens]